MSYRAWFQCINPQCRAEYPLNSIIYRCKTCGSLLEVQHDLQALARRDAKAWMKLFRRPVQIYRVALRLRRVGQKGMDSAADR
jgi:hypothetical protein